MLIHASTRLPWLATMVVQIADNNNPSFAGRHRPAPRLFEAQIDLSFYGSIESSLAIQFNR